MDSVLALGEVIVLRNYLEQFDIPKRNFLAVCICVDCQYTILRDLRNRVFSAIEVEERGTAVKRLMGMPVGIVYKREDCLLCHA